MNPQPSFSKQMQFQRGQAMVEYAILFIVLSILFIGGAELGMAALASYKNTDAAKTGISEYAEVNQRRLNILNAEKQYLNSLAGYDCRVIYQITNDYDETDNVYIKSDGLNPPSPVTLGSPPNEVNVTREMLLADQDDYTCIRPNQETLNAGISINHLADNFQDFLDDIYTGDVEIFATISNSILTNYIDPSCSNYTGTGTESNWNDNSLDDDVCTISEDELNLVTPANQSEGQDKFKLLLLISHIKLSKLPLDSSQPLSQAKIVIGDHASPSFSQPSCNSDGSYDDGFPTSGPEERYVYREYTDVDNNRQIYETGKVLYLFNPLPIDVSSCQGTDSTRNDQSKLSILVGGYGKPDDPLFVPGLPKLNQAMYGMYKNDLGGNLIPPGKMCYLDDDGNDNCPSLPSKDLYVNNVGPTGYYRWNKGSDGSGTEDIFKYTINAVDDDLLNGFRPAMQIECNVSLTAGMESQAVDDDSCAGPYSKLRVHTRYRKIFEGFLTFGLQELNVADGDLDNALKLFYNPNDVGVAGSNQVNGTIDSEIGSLGANGIPTVKRHKDFRGCYEVDIETNQISACN